MTRAMRILWLLPAVLGLALVVGCGSGSAVENKQPKLDGNPDPKIKGPATPGLGGGPKPGEIGEGEGPKPGTIK